MQAVRPLRPWTTTLAVLACVLIGPVSVAAAAPTLDGTAVIGIGTFQLEPGSECHADGSGTIEFSASGDATGPFPGRLTETGTVTLGPEPAGGGYSPVTAYSSSFEIASGDTTVSGTRTFGTVADMARFGSFDLQNVGECLDGQFTTNQFGVGTRYTATITTPEETFSDHGFGHAFGAESRHISPSNLIHEGFASLAGKTAPGAPGPVVAAAGDGSAVVTWVPPASNGGEPISRYTVTAAPGGQTVSVCGAGASQCGITTARVNGLTNGTSYTFTVTAENALGSGEASAPSVAVTPTAGAQTPLVAVGQASATSPTTVATATGSSDVGASVTVPAGTSGGLVSLVQSAPTGGAPAGFEFVGLQTHITAPDATVEQPLRLSFTIDQDLLVAEGLNEQTVEIFRDGVAIAPCDAGTTAASPDPCVESRTVVTQPWWYSPYGQPTVLGARITVRSSHASDWNIGRRKPFEFSGFFAPVDPQPAANTVKAGSAVPLKFGLGGFQGLDVVAAGYPRSVRVPCGSTGSPAPVEQTVAAGGSALSYDAESDRYVYAWKTDRAWSAEPAGPCRQLVLRLTDGTVKRADFRFTK